MSSGEGTQADRADAVALLLRAGALVDNDGGSGVAPVVLAVRCALAAVSEEWLGVVSKFLERGANINAEDEAGNTPLHDAVAAQSTSVTKWLLERGALIEVKNKAGKTPVQLLQGSTTDAAKAVQAMLGEFVQVPPAC